MRKYAISYITASHLDLFWLGDLFTCLDRGTEVTKQYVDDLVEHPERAYFIETAIFAEEFVKQHPGYLDTLKQLIREGRLEVGAAFVDRFENAVGGESLTRHVVIGKRILRDLFDYDSEVSMHPDLPGYAPQIPQIYSKAGIRCYLTSRKLSRDGGMFRFEAPDGSTVLHCHFVMGYGFAEIDKIVERIDEIAQGFPGGRIVAAGGGWDLCGRDTFAEWNGGQLEDLLAAAKEQYPSLELSYGTLIGIAADCEKVELPTRRGEIPSVWGSIASVNLEMWDANVVAERKVLDAELLGGIAASFFGFDPIPPDRPDWFTWRYNNAFWAPKAIVDEGCEFDELWRLVLVPQDHNDGSKQGPETTFQKVQMSKRAVEYSDAISARCLNEIAGRVHRSMDGRPIIIFNQAGWDRSDVVRVEGIDSDCTMTDGAGHVMPVQSAGDSDPGTTEFLACEVPSVGYKTFYVRKKGGPDTAEARAHESDDGITVSASHSTRVGGEAGKRTGEASITRGRS